MIQQSDVFTLESCLLMFAKYNTDRCASTGDSQIGTKLSTKKPDSDSSRLVSYLFKQLNAFFICSFLPSYGTYCYLQNDDR